MTRGKPRTTRSAKLENETNGSLQPVSAKSDATERKPREERWEELLTAAAKIFYRKGYDASSLQDIADEVGILKGSIYYYINSKKDLRNHLVSDVHSNGIKLINNAAMTPGNPLERLEAMILAHTVYLCENLEKSTVYLQEYKNFLADAENVNNHHSYRDVIEGVLRDGQAEGYILPELQPAFTAQVILSSLNSVANWYTANPKRGPRRIADHFSKILVRGHATSKGLRFLARREKAAAAK